MEMVAITCYQSTRSHLMDQRALETSLPVVCFCTGLESCQFLCKGRNDVKISQT